MSQIYEGMFLLDNDVVREGYEGAKALVTSALDKHGATLLSARRWDERRLAYPISGRRRAHELRLAACRRHLHLALAGGAHAVRMQSALLSHLMVDGGERLQREARWSAWRSVVGFGLFLLLGVYWCLEGFYSSSVVWSGIRYYSPAP